MIILTILTIFVIFFSLTLIKYEIKKRKKADCYTLEDYAMTLRYISTIFFFLFMPLLLALSNHIKDYNKYYFKEKNEAELLILENNIFSGTIIKWWTKDYPEIK